MRLIRMTLLFAITSLVVFSAFADPIPFKAQLSDGTTVTVEKSQGNIRSAKVHRDGRAISLLGSDLKVMVLPHPIGMTNGEVFVGDVMSESANSLLLANDKQLIYNNIKSGEIFLYDFDEEDEVGPNVELTFVADEDGMSISRIGQNRQIIYSSLNNSLYRTFLSADEKKISIEKFHTSVADDALRGTQLDIVDIELPDGRILQSAKVKLNYPLLPSLTATTVTTPTPALTQAQSPSKSAAAKKQAYDVNALLSDERLSKIQIRNEESQFVTLADYVRANFQLVTVGKARPEEFEAAAKNLRHATTSLLRRTGGSVIVKGRPGTGKTYFSELLADYITTQNNIPAELRERIYINFSASEFEAGKKFVGQTDVAINALIKLSEIVPVTLFVDEIHTLVGAGTHDTNPIDFMQKLKRHMADGRIKFVGNTTDAEYNLYFSGDRALRERFSGVVNIQETSDSETAKLVGRFIKRGYKKYPFITDTKSLEMIVAIAGRFNPIGANPRKSLDLADYMCSRMVIEKTFRMSQKRVLEYSSSLYNYDLNKFTLSKIQSNLRRFRQTVDKKLIGLEDAKEAIELVLTDHFFKQLARNSKKSTSILTYGPRGVGKTTLAKATADGIGYDFDRIMMSNYRTEFSAEAFKSRLAETIQAHPFQVVLLDEPEKAHPAVQQTLLDVLDSGKFEARLSKVKMQSPTVEVDASNVIFIGATNAGADAKNHAEFETMAERDGLDPYLTDRFSETVRVSAPGEKEIPNILALKWNDMIKEFKAMDRTVKVDVPSLTQELTGQLRSNTERSQGIGFNSHEQIEDISVRPIEREISRVSRQISQFFMKNPSVKEAEVVVENGQITVRAPLNKRAQISCEKILGKKK